MFRLAPMPGRDLVRWGAEHVRVGPWRGDTDIAALTPIPERPPLTTAGVRHCLSVLARPGLRGRGDGGPKARARAQGFLGAGFTVRERLHLPRAGTRRPAARPGRPRCAAPAAATGPRSWRWTGSRSRPSGASTTTPSTTRWRPRPRAGSGSPTSLRWSATRSPARPAGGASCSGSRWQPDARKAKVSAPRSSSTACTGCAGGAPARRSSTPKRRTHALALYERMGFRRQPGGLVVLETALS